MRLRFLPIVVACIAAVWTCADAPPEINLRKTIVVDVVRKTKDAVVNVSTTKLVSRRMGPFDPFWQQFDVGQVVQVPANSLGSGFIIHPDGYIVTNNHVIDRARVINVELADGRKPQAELISADAEADLAILKITSDKPLPTIELGDSSDLPTEDGLLVKEVAKESVAARAGIAAGDIIVQIGRYRISKLSDLSVMLHRMIPGSQARVAVIRGEQLGYGTLEMKE
jgi:S1-C subfamily serine protease